MFADDVNGVEIATREPRRTGTSAWRASICAGRVVAFQNQAALSNGDSVIMIHLKSGYRAAAECFSFCLGEDTVAQNCQIAPGAGHSSGLPIAEVRGQPTGLSRARDNAPTAPPSAVANTPLGNAEQPSPTTIPFLSSKNFTECKPGSTFWQTRVHLSPPSVVTRMMPLLTPLGSSSRPTTQPV